jgi:thymidylate synthase (FAD)
MNIIKQSVTLMQIPENIATILEFAARTCTSSVEQMREGNAEDFVKRVIMARKHYSVLEHVSFTFELITTRAIANQIVRHRMAAYCQESMRYVRMDRKTGGLPVIAPYQFDNWPEEAKKLWLEAVQVSEDNYMDLLKMKIKAEDARGVLPLDTATVLVATWNLRELLHILYHPVSGRCTNSHAQPQTRQLFTYLENEIKNKLPFVYELCEIYKETN